MLHFYPSNYTENLATVVAQIMKVKPLSNPFAEELILIQSHGMGQWLQQKISDELGIAAMINTAMPASFIWRLAEKLLPEDKVIPLFEKQNLRWQLMKVLPAKLDEPAYKPLADYLKAQSFTKESQNDLPQQVLYQLCNSIADLFDAYQNYRSDWIAAWEKGERLFESDAHDSLLRSTESWLQDLWQSAYANIDMDARRHRPNVLEKLSQKLAHPDAALKANLPERLFVFGLSALPPQWLPVFEQLSRYVDIHFLVFNPCQQYWGDIQSEMQQLTFQKRLIEQGIKPETAAESVFEANALLASWGQLGRDYVALLAQNAAISEIPIDLYESPGESSALGAIQQDILNLQSHQRVIAGDDESIRFAHCHSRLREVEALHDHLFSMLDRNAHLSPKDIIVMMPDVQSFAPLIDAVFSRSAQDQHGQRQRLPYAISDQMLAMEQPLLDVMVGLLNLTSSRISARDVTDWLDTEAIRKRFGISEQELLVIHHWIDQLAIRWGLSEKHRDQLLETKNSGEGNTWLSAFSRLIAGYFYCSESDHSIIDDAVGKVLPVSFSDREQQALAGKMMRFLDVIELSCNRLKGDKPVAEWLENVALIWQQWFDDQSLPDEVQALMDAALTKTHEQILLAGFEAPVSFDVVADALLTHFEKERVSQRFLAGRINFCTLMPMRSIPFKVVCLIGMNEGDYPRLETNVSFDLMSMTPGRAGDRSRRSDDRYLFLEALCSAREQLYLSYCAHDARDNSEQFPSILVSELRDYCARTFTVEVDNAQIECLKHWTIEHRLQPFHTAYFSGDANGQLLSYSDNWLALHHEKSIDDALSMETASSRPVPSESVSLETADAMQLDDLVSWANHPLRYYYQNTLGVRFYNSAPHMEESEPFALNALEQHKLKQGFAATWMNEAETEEVVAEQWTLADRLPRPPASELDLDKVRESLTGLKSKVQAFGESPQGQVREQKIHVVVNDITIEGEITVASQGQVSLSLSKHVGGQFFGFWVKHLVWNLYLAQQADNELTKNMSGQSLLLGPEKNHILKSLSADQAQNCLGEILSEYRHAQMKPTVFLPKTAYAQIFEGQSKANTAFNGWGDIAGEASDPYWHRACILVESFGVIEAGFDLPFMGQHCLYQQVEEQFSKEAIQLAEGIELSLTAEPGGANENA